MNNKIVLVTGSSRGIGFETAEYFLKNGSTVILNCKKNVSEMEHAAEMLKNAYKNVYAYKADVSSYAECEKMFGEIIKTYNRIDVLINNAGISHIGLLQQTDESMINEIININLAGSIFCSKLAAADMVKRHSGVIISISSVWGNAGASCESVYSASKGGLNAFTKALAKELGPAGIRVNAIACGVIDTKMNDWLPEDDRVDLLNQIPLKRFGMPADVAELAYFLASDNSSYITGQIINIDGGYASIY